MSLRLVFAWLIGITTFPICLAGEWTLAQSIPCPDATQAAAADNNSFYAVSNTRVVKLDRNTGRQSAISTGEAQHLNSAVFNNGRCYLAHSNYPQRPERSVIKVLDPESMKLSDYHDFGQSDGSLTWAVPVNGEWWCNFAFYDDENHRSYLVRFDKDWRELGRWTYPKALLDKLGRHSLSGGIRRGDHFLVSGHDDPKLFRVQVPDISAEEPPRGELKLLDEEPAALTGQGFAEDPKLSGLVGINRAKRELVLLKYRESQ